MLNTLELRQIKYFVALYEEQSITRAAERLHVVQPAVSMQIRKLETDYGVVLFDRTSQGVLPNDSAHELYRLCTGIMGDLDIAHHFLLGATGRVFGELAVGVPPSLSLGAMPRILAKYADKFPEVKLRVAEGYSATIVEWLENGSVDVGILSDEYRLSKFSFEPIVEEELVMVSSSQLATELGGEITGAQFASMPMVLPSKPHLLRRLIDIAYQEHGIALEPLLEVDSFTTVLGLLRAGRHATMLPLSCVADITAALSLHMVHVREPRVKRTLIAVHLAQKQLSRPAEAFIKTLSKELCKVAASCRTGSLAPSAT